VIGLPDGVRVYLAAGRTDLRRGIDGLAAQIQTELRQDPSYVSSEDMWRCRCDASNSAASVSFAAT
jgi:hypothetical protein